MADTKTTTKSGKLAVIKTGGKQYLVQEGQTIKIEKILDESVKDTGKITFEEVLMISEGDKVSVGTPFLEKSKVQAELIAEGRNKKISVIRFKSKSRYFKNKGHRQPFYSVKITKIA